MALYKEIVTKAVIGKGKKSFKNNYTINLKIHINKGGSLFEAIS